MLGSTNISILGLQWFLTSDTFTYQFNITPKPLTKRHGLSLIASIYDPYGFLTPLHYASEMVMQIFCGQSSFSGAIHSLLTLLSLANIYDKHWSFISNLYTPLFTIIEPITSGTTWILRRFWEWLWSSYLRMSSTTGCSNPYLVHNSQESSLASLRLVTISRLELCSTHFLAHLVHYYFTIYSQLQISPVHLWYDSSIAFTWIQTPTYCLKIYIVKRVAKIQELLPVRCWHHVPTQENPADCT